jgi:UrcA family protein
MRTASLLAAATALAIAAPAAAQPFAGPTEEVIVHAPPYQGQQRSEIGAPIDDVSLSREVHFDDLDLRTSWGQDTLRDRVRRTAMSLCQDLENRYPVTADGSPPCFRTAYDDAMGQAETAIRNARVAAR